MSITSTPHGLKLSYRRHRWYARISGHVNSCHSGKSCPESGHFLRSTTNIGIKCLNGCKMHAFWVSEKIRFKYEGNGRNKVSKDLAPFWHWKLHFQLWQQCVTHPLNLFFYTFFVAHHKCEWCRYDSVADGSKCERTRSMLVLYTVCVWVWHCWWLRRVAKHIKWLLV